MTERARVLKRGEIRRKRPVVLYCHGCKGLLQTTMALPAHLVCEGCGRMHTLEEEIRDGEKILTLDSSPTGKLVPAGPDSAILAKKVADKLQVIIERHRKIAANLNKLVAMYLRDCAALEIEPEIDIDENPSTDFDVASRENGCEIVLCKPRETND